MGLKKGYSESDDPATPTDEQSAATPATLAAGLMPRERAWLLSARGRWQSGVWRESFSPETIMGVRECVPLSVKGLIFCVDGEHTLTDLGCAVAVELRRSGE